MFVLVDTVHSLWHTPIIDRGDGIGKQETDMTYRVTYPLISTDGHREFDTREEAEAFAREKRNNLGRFQTVNSWQLVKVEEVGR